MKEVFSYNSDTEKTAYMNWRTNRYDEIGNMIVIADGFMEAAILLAESALADNSDKKADIIVYPMLFNANHAIELYLKAITWTLNILRGNMIFIRFFRWLKPELLNLKLIKREEEHLNK